MSAGAEARSGELLVGGVVLAAAAAFLGFAFLSAGAGPAPAGYALTALFDRVDGVAVGSDVRLAGVKIGAVSAVELDPQTFQAKLELRLNKAVSVPADTSARIATDGLLGGAYVALEVGSDGERLKPGSEIVYTQGSVDLLTLFANAAGRGGESGGE
jgi:phospholipid/cholesterol/gamma-HCH transport system substrate-binding protein